MSISDLLKSLYDNLVLAVTTCNEFTEALPDCYDAVEAKGGTLPQEQTAGNLADAIESIPSAGGGYPLTAIMSDGTAYIELPIIVSTFANKNPKFVCKVTDTSYGNGSTAADTSLFRSVRYSDNYHRIGFIWRNYNNDLGAVAVRNVTDKRFSSSLGFVGVKLDCYIERPQASQYYVYAKLYGDAGNYTQSPLLYSLDSERDQDAMQLVAGKGIWLYSLILDNEEYIPYFNGTECGLLNTTTNVFYGNSNTAGTMIGIVEP